jgi:FkbM family methyltransferase
MPCSTLNELPPPSSGKTGWPWTEANSQLPNVMPNGQPWPKISIVTPSYNQAQFLEETIRSVLLQGYPNLEYMVIDGGSADGSVDIIRKYEQWLTYWVSEKDNGQSDAINKGLRRIGGEIFNWINSDDTLLPGALAVVGEWFAQHPKAQVGYGSFRYVKADGTFDRQVDPQYSTLEAISEYWELDRGITQQALFVRWPLVRALGLLETDLNYNMDYEWQCRLIRQFPFHKMTGETLATYRLHTTSKSVSELFPFLKERGLVARRFWPSWLRKKRWQYEMESNRFLKHMRNKADSSQGRQTSFFTSFRRWYDQLRQWRYRQSPDTAQGLALSDFIDYSKEFVRNSGLRQLLVTEDGIFVRTTAGFFFWFDPRHNYGKLWGLEKNHEWEPELMQLCLDKLRDASGTFLDIGANVGFYSIILAGSLPDVIVHAFEPVPDNFRVLETNVRVNPTRNKIVLNQLAVSDQCGTTTIALNGQLSHILQSVTDSQSNVAEVDAISLDNYCQKNGIKNVRLIKCDVEGFELFVLRGAERILIEQKPTILLEIEDRWIRRYGYDSNDLVTFLANLGYAGKTVAGYDNAYWFEPIEHE